MIDSKRDRERDRERRMYMKSRLYIYMCVHIIYIHIYITHTYLDLCGHRKLFTSSIFEHRARNSQKRGRLELRVLWFRGQGLRETQPPKPEGNSRERGGGAHRRLPSSRMLITN